MADQNIISAPANSTMADRNSASAPTDSIKPSSRALILIDLQNEFMHTDGNFICPDKSTIPLVNNLTALIPRFRAAGGHIIWVQALYIDRTNEPAGMKTTKKDTNEWLTQAIHVYEVSCCKPDTFGAELYEPLYKLAAPADSLVTKTGYSSFWETDALKTCLENKGVTEVFYAGLASKRPVSWLPSSMRSSWMAWRSVLSLTAWVGAARTLMGRLWTA